MLQIECPWCGLRDEPEFSYGGPSHVTRPTQEVSDAGWAEYLFTRANPKGVLRERWRHTFGCGQWFNLARDTVTHRIVEIYRMGDASSDE